MVGTLLLSLLAHGLSAVGYPVLESEIQETVRRIDFSEILMTWFLPSLLFAGALHVNLDDLRSYKWPITFLTTGGVLISTFVVAGLAYYTFALFGWQVSFIYCLLFGALISPTDPIAVMGILKSSGAPKFQLAPVSHAQGLAMAGLDERLGRWDIRPGQLQRTNVRHNDANAGSKPAQLAIKGDSHDRARRP